MTTFKELLDAIESVKIGEYTALNFSAYITAQINDTKEDRGKEFLSPMDAFYIGYFMGNLPVLLSCRDRLTDEMLDTNEEIKPFEDVMTRHDLWTDFEECVKFTKTQV